MCKRTCACYAQARLILIFSMDEYKLWKRMAYRSMLWVPTLSINSLLPVPLSSAAGLRGSFCTPSLCSQILHSTISYMYACDLGTQSNVHNITNNWRHIMSCTQMQLYYWVSPLWLKPSTSGWQLSTWSHSYMYSIDVNLIRICNLKFEDSTKFAMYMYMYMYIQCMYMYLQMYMCIHVYTCTCTCMYNAYTMYSVPSRSNFSCLISSRVQISWE